MYLLSRLRSFTSSPIRRWLDVDPRVGLESSKALKQTDEEEGRLVVCELLAEADARSSVERAKDEWIWRQVFMNPLVKKSVWIEF
jgi:hypothetical protein